jgi:peptide/nickel transport system permease protein
MRTPRTDRSAPVPGRAATVDPVSRPAATWGGLLSSDLSYLAYQPWAPVAPALLIIATVWACNLLADAIRDVSGEAGRAAVNMRPKWRRKPALIQGGR